MAWYNSSWLKRKPITLTGGSSGAQSAYQVKLTVTHETGDMKSDFSDLRFTKADGTTLLDAWMESHTASTSAVVWVETDTPANTVEADIFMYYGNSGAASDWDIDATMLFGDEFPGSAIDGAKWNKTGTWNVSGGTTINVRSGAPILVTVNQVLSGHSDYAIESRARGGHDYGGVSITSETLATGAHTTGYYNRWGVIYGSTGGPVLYVDNVFKNNPGYDCTVSTWYRNKMIVNPSGTHYSYLYSDARSLLATASTTDDSSSSTGYLAINARDGISEIDVIFVRKYAANPATYSFGGEESESTIIPVIMRYYRNMRNN